MVRQLHGDELLKRREAVNMALQQIEKANEKAEAKGQWMQVELCYACTEVSSHSIWYDAQVLNHLDLMSQLAALSLPRVKLIGFRMCDACFVAHSRHPGEASVLLPDYETREEIIQLSFPSREDRVAWNDLIRPTVLGSSL